MKKMHTQQGMNPNVHVHMYNFTLHVHRPWSKKGAELITCKIPSSIFNLKVPVDKE